MDSWFKMGLVELTVDMSKVNLGERVVKDFEEKLTKMSVTQQKRGVM